MELLEETQRIEDDVLIIDQKWSMPQPLSFINIMLVLCGTEDSHTFDSTGQCTKCGTHRRPK